jgi:drug/metabolite transporter (DMT)-like permease
LLPFAIANWPTRMVEPAAWIAIAVLGVVCTAVGLIVFFRLIAEAGPARAAVITYVNPLVAVLVGVLTLGERLSAASFVGLLLILVGSWISTGGHIPEKRPEAQNH